MEETGDVVHRMAEEEFQRRRELIQSDESIPPLAREMIVQNLKLERRHRDRHQGSDIVACEDCGERFCKACIEEDAEKLKHTCK